MMASKSNIGSVNVMEASHLSLSLLHLFEAL